MDDRLRALAGALATIQGAAAVVEGQSLARYTSLRVGGPADLLYQATSSETLRRAVTLAREQGVAWRVLGAGSNVLVADRGVRGLVIVNRARAVDVGPERVRAESGAALATVARLCGEQGLAGLEWASGIPGTVGGAVVGNAGAWGSDVASTLAVARVVEAGGHVADWPAARLGYRYRGSVLKGEGREPAVVLEAEFRLRPADRETVRGRMADIAARRKASQPTGATCGSVFKNPPGDYAGRLLEAAGMKGRRQGEAVVSTLHANFFINEGGATAADVWALVTQARIEVQARFGVALELEIELLGNWGPQD